MIEARRTAWREHRRLRACERFPLRPDEVAQLGVVRAAIAHVAVHEDDLRSRLRVDERHEQPEEAIEDEGRLAGAAGGVGVRRAW